MHFFNGHWGGMHFVWWIIWLILLIWVFFVPYDIPYRKLKKENPLAILKKRFVNGEITKEEFEESKRILKSE